MLVPSHKDALLETISDAFAQYSIALASDYIVNILRIIILS